MYTHGAMMFPDYIAIVMLVGTITFILSLICYAVLEIVRIEFIRAEIEYVYEVFKLWKGA